MAPMSSTEHPGTYDAQTRWMLLELAARSIQHGLSDGEPLQPNLLDYPTALRDLRATFVTLEMGGTLRGCIGALTPVRPLVEDVAHNAFAAAFEDPRFPGLASEELWRLEIHVSVLSPTEPLDCISEADLLRQIRPGVDGLILEDGGRRGTFLPSVWEQLPSPAQFFEHLRLKAGMPAGHWSDSLQVSRYTTQSFGAEITAILDARSRETVQP